MMMNGKILIALIYIVGIIISICGFAYLTSDLKLLCVLSFGLLSYKFIKYVTKFDDAPSFFIVLSIIFVLSLLFGFLEKKQIKKEMKEYGSIVTIAIIDNINNYRSDHSLDCHYMTLSGIYVDINATCGKDIAKVKKVNDTILIRYSKLNQSRYVVYKFFPTREEIKKYMNGMSYEQDSVQNNKAKQK